MITLEEARTLDSLAKHGSIAKVAQEFRKANSSIVYVLDSIEEKTGLKVFNRTGYRTTVSEQGARLLEASRRLLACEAEFESLCRTLRDGWESDLKVIVEGVVPLEPILRSVAALSRKEAPTRFHIRAGFLSEVESTFTDSGADLMISVLPPRREDLESIPLAEVPAVLVAHRDHPLWKSKQASTIEELRAHALLTVRGSDPRLNMSTASIEPNGTIELNDFYSKKLALVNGLGFGWMPRYLIENELRRGLLKPVRWKGTSHHRFRPYLYYRGERRLGKAGRLLIETLRRESGT